MLGNQSVSIKTGDWQRLLSVFFTGLWVCGYYFFVLLIFLLFVLFLLGGQSGHPLFSELCYDCSQLLRFKHTALKMIHNTDYEDCKCESKSVMHE